MWSTSKAWKVGHVIKTKLSEKFPLNKRSTSTNGPQLKIKIQIRAYRRTFGKDPLKLENFVSNPQLNMI